MTKTFVDYTIKTMRDVSGMAGGIASEIWGQVVEILRTKMSEVSFRTWIEPIVPIKIFETTFTIAVPYIVTRDMVASKYAPMIESALAAVTALDCSIDIVLDDERQVHEVYNNFSARFKYTFENFVVGKNSELAYAAAEGVAEDPSSKWNPLFIYGGSGLGKTHLLHAIANQVKNNDSTRKVLFCTSEEFLNDLVQAIRTSTNPSFREKYRRSDMLLVDDIQFMAGKDAMQEEFHHTFNDLFNNGKQIVLASDKPPSEIPRMTERLQTRFQGGLTVDIQPPGFETRLAILRSKFQSEHITIDNKIVEYIAEEIRSNVRDLEGAIQKMMAYAKISRSKEVSMELAQRALKDIFAHKKQKKVNVEVAMEEVERYYNLPKGALKSQKRSHEIAFPRHVAMYIAREVIDVSFPQIGRDFGGRDHTTVMASVKRIKKELAETPGLQESIDDIVNNIYKN